MHIMQWTESVQGLN